MTIYPGVAVITGAASGIGRTTATSFAAEGCTKIAICDLNEPGLEETKSLILAANSSADVLVVPLNVASEEAVQSAFATIISRFQRIDYAVNAAGVVGAIKPTHDYSAAEFDFVNGINYRGVFLCSREELRQMLTQEPLPTHDGRPGNRGSIVNIASQLGLVGRPCAPAYCGSKAAVMALTRSDAIDVGAYGLFLLHDAAVPALFHAVLVLFSSRSSSK
jgi:NAD(P)-dependent dehydrogenase (short-subunit alcohol dehydrogenase family)